MMDELDNFFDFPDEFQVINDKSHDAIVQPHRKKKKSNHTKQKISESKIQYENDKREVKQLFEHLRQLQDTEKLNFIKSKQHLVTTTNFCSIMNTLLSKNEVMCKLSSTTVSNNSIENVNSGNLELNKELRSVMKRKYDDVSFL